MLTDIASIVAIVGFPLAFIGIYLASREGRTSRDLQSALAFSEAFLAKWNSSWRDAVAHLGELSRGRNPDPVHLDAITDVFDWLHSFGVMIESGLLARPELVLKPIEPLIKRIIDSGWANSLLEGREGSGDPGRWHGVRILQKALHLSEDKA